MTAAKIEAKCAFGKVNRWQLMENFSRAFLDAIGKLMLQI